MWPPAGILDSPLLCDLPGVGVEVASQLLVTVGDNLERVGSEAQFAALAGVVPIPASSGKTSRHRLTRGGDRNANKALHQVVLVRVGPDPRTKESQRRGDLLGPIHPTDWRQFLVHLWAGIDRQSPPSLRRDRRRWKSSALAKVPNDEPAVLPHRHVLKLGGGDEVVWATDLKHGGPALLIALLFAHGQDILYIPGRIVRHASRLYRGEGKTVAKDAAVVADQASPVCV